MEVVAVLPRKNREMHRFLVNETVTRKRQQFRLEGGNRIRTCVIDELLAEAG